MVVHIMAWLSHNRTTWPGIAIALLACAGCAEPEPAALLTSDVCGADAPQFRGLCVVTANEIYFRHAGPARSFTVVRTVNSVSTGTVERLPENKENFTYHLDAKEPFARYKIFFSGSPALDLEFYHGANIRPLLPKPTGSDDEIALWWIADDGRAATRMTYHGASGVAETYDLKTFAQTGSYKLDTEKLFPYGKHMLLRYSADRTKVEHFYPETNSATTFVEADAPIHSFWRQGEQIAVQTEDGTLSMPALGLSHMFPLVYIAYADMFEILAWRRDGAGCGLALVRLDWGGGMETVSTKSGLCEPLFGFSFLGNTLLGVVVKGDKAGGIFIGTRDLDITYNFTGSMPYTDDKIGVARTNRLEYAYQNGTSSSEQGLLECAAGAQDMNPNAGISLFYETGTVLVDDIPEHLSELTTHQNIKSCFGY